MTVKLSPALAFMTSAMLLLTVCSAWAESPQDRAAAAERRWVEYQEMLQSNNPISRSEALSAALVDENLGIRGNALWSILQRRQMLPLEVVVPPGGRMGPGEVPSVAISRLRWNSELRTLEGVTISFGSAGSVTGSILSGKLQILYAGLRVMTRFGLPADVQPTRNDFSTRHCSVNLALNPSHDALEGPLRCEEMREMLAIRMPLE